MPVTNSDSDCNANPHPDANPNPHAYSDPHSDSDAHSCLFPRRTLLYKQWPVLFGMVRAGGGLALRASLTRACKPADWNQAINVF